MKPTAPRQSAQVATDPDLKIALSKARAASFLLAAIPDYLQIPAGDITDEQAEEVYGWIQNFAFGALDAALEEAEAARQGKPKGDMDRELTLEEAAARLQLDPSTMKKWLRRQLEELGKS